MINQTFNIGINNYQTTRIDELEGMNKFKSYEGTKMRLKRISTEWGDGILWDDAEIDNSVWDGFYVIFEVIDADGESYHLQYIACRSQDAERDSENPNDSWALEGQYYDFLSDMDSLASEISNRTIQIEIDNRKIEMARDKLEIDRIDLESIMDLDKQ